MKKTEYIKKIKEMDEKTLAKETGDLIMSIRKNRLEISANKSNKFGQLKTDRTNLARLKTEAISRLKG